MSKIFLQRCTLPLTACNCVDMIVTEMAVFSRDSNGLILDEMVLESPVDDVRRRTAAIYRVSETLHTMTSISR